MFMIDKKRLSKHLLILAGAASIFANSAYAEGLFGSIEFKAASISAVPQWTRVLKKIETEQGAFIQCDDAPSACTSPSLLAWRSRLKDMASMKPFEQLREINDFANNSPYRFDHDAWGKSDYWASPTEFLKNSGDCEDYAILKYVSLKKLGFDEDKMRLAVVHDTIRNLAHAVLVVELNEKQYVLDSLFNAVLPHDQVMQYIPYYSVNEKSRWAHVMPLKNVKK